MPSTASPISRFVLLPCTVTEGMFSSECAVQIKIGNESVSLFVDRSLIVTRGENHYLRVNFAGENHKPNNNTILLPSEAFETGSRWLSVPESMILAA